MSAPGADARYAAVLEALRSGRLDEGSRAADAIARTFPGDARAHALVARCANARGEHAVADAAIGRALALDVNCIPALLEQVQLARPRHDHAASAAALGRLAALQPGHVGFQFDLGVSLARLGRDPDAAAAFERALAIAPTLAEAWLNFGATLIRLGRSADAARAYARALELEPARVEALDGYARAIYAGGGTADQVLAPTRRAVELAPESGEAWHRHAVALRMVDRLDECHGALGRALELAPSLLAARWDSFEIPRDVLRGDAAADQAFLERWRQGLEWFERLDVGAAAVRNQLRAAGALETNFYLHYLDRPLVDEQRRYARVVQRLAHALCAPKAPKRAPRTARVRLGFVSAMFRNHSVMKVFAPLILGLPRDRFEITLYHLDGRQDQTTAALRARADHYFGGNRDLAPWHELMASRPLDALAYVDIGLHGMSQYLAAYRFAPLQCALWGHPVTTGFPDMDFFVGSEAMEPPDGDANYSETLVRLPRLGTCFGTPDVHGTAPSPVPDEPGTVRYLVAQTALKLTPLHDEIYARIAADLPQARFVILPHWRAEVREALAARMRTAFERRGLAFDRHVRILPWLTAPAFFGLLGSVGVNLDTIGFSGCVSTFEISAAGVPTVTLPGALMRARQSGAMMRRMGLDELCARDVDDYVRIAVALGREPERRARLASLVAERRHLLYEDRGVVEAFAAFVGREVDARS